MAIVAGTVITKVRNQLIDTGDNPRWTDGELLAYLSDAVRTVVAIAPAAAAAPYVLPLVAGTRQPLGENVHTILTVLRNCNDDGTIAGRAVRVVLREQMDAADPDWHNAAASSLAKNYIYDPDDVAFYVWPPNDGTGYIQVLYAAVPAELTDLTDEVALLAIYETALFDYVMFRAHQKDSDFAAGQAIAGTYLSAFTAFLGVTDEKLRSVNPNLQTTPTNMAVEGAAK